MNKPSLLSGITPSGVVHIGNYLGAIRQWVELQKTHHVFAMVADLHAITVPQEPAALYENTLRMVKLLVACGIDPKRSVLFIQSHVPAHTELAWLLNTMTPVGELERMTQFKEKKERAGVLAGLLNYPTLMAADILLYHAALVPVGEDQLQHLELTRNLAQKFNTRFGKVFTLPQSFIQKDTARVMGLDDSTKKMSKSAPSKNNYISLLDRPDEIRQKIKIAVTDSGSTITYDETKKPAIANLMRIYQAFSGTPLNKIQARYMGKGYADFKRDLAELLIKHLSPIQKKYRALATSRRDVEKIIGSGALRAQAVAQKTFSAAKHSMGLLPE